MTGQGGMKRTREGKRKDCVIGGVTGTALRKQGERSEGAFQRPCLAAAQQHAETRRGRRDERACLRL